MKKLLFPTLFGLMLFTIQALALELVNPETEKKIDALLEKMRLEEKIGQMTQRNSWGASEEFEQMIRDGNIGSVLNEVNTDQLNKIQKIALEETRMGIPLIMSWELKFTIRGP